MGFILSWLEPEVKRSKIWALWRWRQLSSFISTFLSPPSPKNILPFTIWDNSVNLALCQIIWIVKDPMMWNTIKRAPQDWSWPGTLGRSPPPPTASLPNWLIHGSSCWFPLEYNSSYIISCPKLILLAGLHVQCLISISYPPPSSLSIPMVWLLKGWIPRWKIWRWRHDSL